MNKLKVDQETGEILPTAIMVKAEKAPTVSIDINDVRFFHNDPEKLVDKIRQQAGFIVFDVSTEKGRSACRSHAANIIRCIAPAINASKELASDAQKIVKQDLAFRRVFEDQVREIAAFHRKPLTEWEEEQERIKEEARIAEEKRIAEEQYLRDWQEALDFDELFTLRREKAEAERKAFQEQCEREERERIEREIAERLEAERERIRLEEEAKARREAEDKLRAEQAEKERIEREAKQAAELVERERLERENQEMLEQAADLRKQSDELEKAKAINEEKPNIEASKNPPAEQVPLSHEGIQGESEAIEIIPGVVVDVEIMTSVKTKPATFRHKAINALMGYYDTDYDTIEAWLISEFSQSATKEAA